MSRPDAKIVVNSDGVMFESNVDACRWTLYELIRAALMDTGKYLRIKLLERIHQEVSISGGGGSRHRRIYNSQYWVRKRENDLQVGFKHDSWYSVGQELGNMGQQKLGILRDTVYSNIGTIQEIHAQYLSALNDANPSVQEVGEVIGDDVDG